MPKIQVTQIFVFCAKNSDKIFNRAKENGTVLIINVLEIHHVKNKHELSAKTVMLNTKQCNEFINF